ncbi:SRPBCC domain-containing protein [Aquimarina gracilis]|uniref:SRPBCC domain-containing protein n=1 Tax=Aquimarina gracilis TaxID=874422 RepID=A0ABU5ZYP7_9FLAO|nr:SRPBCC domain-containing protein [Aquimarina gracilis]MEB3346976.1 SRPBCC domain-containing protein [Aquimarina gracilis]
MEYSIKHLFHINTSLSKVYEAISTIEGLSNWWTIQTKGNTALNETIQFDFGGTKGPTMKVIKLEPAKEIVWQCIASPHGWKDHIYTFSLDKNEGKTRVQFSHSGWKESNDFYAHCNFTWGRYLESLRQYCETGRGAASGSE